MKTGLFLLSAFFLFASCSTVPEKLGFAYNPPIELWVEHFESGDLSREEFLRLVRGEFRREGNGGHKNYSRPAEK
jgi:hypothetical protein